MVSALGILATPTAVGAPDRPIVAAASVMQYALQEVAGAFEEDTGRSVRLTFASSGNLRRQIAQGAPFELYLSADERFVEILHDEGHLVDGGVRYAVGSLAIVTRGDRGELADGSLEALRQRLEAGELRRLAIANPEHAPYGVAARQALEHAGLWEKVEPHLVQGESVAQAARFAMAGEVDGGIVAYSLLQAPHMREQPAFALIPRAHYEPVQQRMALVEGAGETARAFYEYLQGDRARAILRNHGFEPPSDP